MGTARLGQAWRAFRGRPRRLALASLAVGATLVTACAPVAAATRPASASVPAVRSLPVRHTPRGAGTERDARRLASWLLPSRRLPGTHCPSFPANAVWDTPITTLPVDSHSAQWLASMNASTTHLHPDYGPSGNPKVPYGIPWTVMTPATPLTKVTFQYASQSDKGPYPFTATTPIEGGPHAGGDRHAIMVSSATCRLYELWEARYHPGGRSTAGSGAIWKLTSDALRPSGWTSADAAGLPILPLLVNYDEVKSGAMDHAIRVTATCTQPSYLWPARHEAGNGGSRCPPMGARFRLDASFTLPASRCSAFCQTVLTTMKTYGLAVADNGGDWFFQGTMDTRWTATEVDQLKQIPASEFQAVDESCMRVSANSAQAYQPGTPAYTAHCASQSVRPARVSLPDGSLADSTGSVILNCGLDTETGTGAAADRHLPPVRVAR